MAVSTPAFAGTATSNTDVDATAINAPVNIGARGFAIPAETTFAPLPSYLGAATPSSSFQSIQTILTYGITFTKSELERMAKGSGVFKSVKVKAKALIDVEGPNTDDPVLTIYLRKPTEGKIMQIGFITANAENVDNNSVEVLGKAGLAALKMNANALHVTAEGAHRILKAFGWGFGSNTTHASMNGTEQDYGNVTSGGFGLSGGTAGYKDMPWLQMFALVVE